MAGPALGFMQKIFGTQPVQATPPVQVTNNPAQNTPTQQTQQTQQTDSNGVVPTQPATPESPTAKFDDLWQPVKTETPDPNSPNPNPQQNQIDPQKLMEAAAKVDFTQVLKPEDLAKVSQGGQEAVQVLMSSLNTLAQQTYGRSVVATAKIVEQAIAEAQKKFEERIPTAVSRVTARDALITENPAFANPAVAPVVDMIQAQFAQKYPKATPAELNKMAKEYLQTAAGVFNPVKQDQSTTQKNSGETDWDSYLQ